MRSIGPWQSLANIKMRGKRSIRLNCGCCRAHDLRARERERTHRREERIADALIEAEAAASIQCVSCAAVIDDDATAPYCRNCKSYWDDVRDGMFDDDDWGLADDVSTDLAGIEASRG